jgi:hypothetical protein
MRPIRVFKKIVYKEKIWIGENEIIISTQMLKFIQQTLYKSSVYTVHCWYHGLSAGE